MRVCASASRSIGEPYLLVKLALFYVAIVWVPSTTLAICFLTGSHDCLGISALVSVGALAACTYMLFGRSAHREAYLVGVTLSSSIGIACLLSVALYDTSTDGRWYHADAILALLKGANPILQSIQADQPIWANHYPKASWYFAAVLIHACHCYQLGKVYNFLLIFASAAYATDFFRRHGVGAGYAVCLGGTSALSAVASAQIVTYCVDGLLGSLLTIIIMSSANLVFVRRRFDAVIFALCVSLAIAVKFTGLVYVVVIVGIALLCQLRRNRLNVKHNMKNGLLPIIGSGVASVLLGVFVLGFAPYVTNVQQGLHPMYPVLGNNRIDIVTPNLPPAFLGHSYSRGYKFAVSFFASSLANSNCRATTDSTHLTAIPGCHEAMKIPFAVKKEELLSLGVASMRLAGWGLFFSGITLASLALFILYSGWRHNSPIVLAIACVLITTIINPECWWARYVPQLSLLPILCLAAVLTRPGKFQAAIVRILCVLLVIEGVMACCGSMTASYIKSRRLERDLAALAQEFGRGEYWAYRNPDIPGESWAFKNPNSKVHFDQFSGLEGIVICAQLAAPGPRLPAGGFPIAMNMRGVTEVTLYKGGCSRGQPF